MTVHATLRRYLPALVSRIATPSIALVALALLPAACSNEISVTGLRESGRETGVSADLTLATIDGAGLPFNLGSTGEAIVEVMSGNLNLQQDGSFMRQTSIRTTSSSTQQADVSSNTDLGSYTLAGESLTLFGRGGTLTGTLVGGQATLQIDGREWAYR
jgi:hypothetical protein